MQEHFFQSKVFDCAGCGLGNAQKRSWKDINKAEEEPWKKGVFT